MILNSRIPNGHFGINFPNSGNWIEISKEQKVWQLSIEAPNAIALSLYYKDFYIPQGAKLFIYNSDHTHIIGAYTEKTNSHAKNFATELIAGDKIILEYVPAKGQTEEPKISISGINYGYNNLSVQYNGNMGLSQYCQVNISCAPQWDDQRDGVYKVLFKKDGDVFLCTGSMLNNTLQDLTPYSLTAFHCIDGVSEGDMNGSIFYFNYQKEACDGTETDIDIKTMVGASVLVRTALEGNSDGALIKLNIKIPMGYNVYYNGWDHKGAVPKSGTSIHHPAGDVKKIATYDNNKTASTSWNNDLARDTHWKIYWDSGLTEGGSSGAPLFNEDRNIVGSLSGAPNYPNPCSALDNYSLFGKFSSFWENADIKQYLDPTGLVYSRLSGTRSIDKDYLDFTILNNIEEIYVGQTLIVRNESIAKQSLTWKVTPPNGPVTTYTTQDLSLPLIEEGNYTILLESPSGTLEKRQSFTTKTRKGKIEEEITIGEGKMPSVGLESPLGQGYTLTRTSSVYNSLELGVAGSITSLSWDATGESSNGRKLEVYLKHVSSADLSDSWDENISSATLVYTSPDNWSNIKGWNLIDFDIPFEYDGISYLQVLTISKSQGELERVTVYCSSTQNKKYKSWNTVNLCSNATFMPNIKIGISRTIAPSAPSARWAYAVKTWSEGFDNSESLSEWTVDSSSGNGWQIGETIPPFSDIDPLSKKSVLVGENTEVNARTKLVSPTISVPANSPRIEFYLAHGRGNGMIDFAISRDGGTTWNQRITIDQDPSAGDWTWNKHEIDISAYRGENIKLMFLVSGKNGLVALDGLKLSSLEEKVKIKQGEYIYPVDLSTGAPTTYNWNFLSGSPSSSENPNPGAIKYSILGKHDVELKVTNALNTDTYSLLQSVEVAPEQPVPLFEAKGGYQMHPNNGRFIPLGANLEFTDNSIFTDNIEWAFAEGNPSTSTDPNPTINYASEGDFDVELKANNQYSSNSLNKTGYVKVGGSSKIWNIPQGNAGTTAYDKIGTNGDSFTIFAERFDKTTFGVISEVDILFQVSSANDENIYIRVHSADVNGLPNEVLAQKELNINDINTLDYTTVQFDSPVPVHGVFFISVSVNNISSDIKILASTANTGKNTAYLHYDDSYSYWSTIKDEFGMNLSLNIVPTFKFAGTYKLKFNSKGGETITDADVIYYQSVGELPTPRRNTFTFKGWFWDLEDPSSIYSDYAIYEFEEDKTLYALWEENLPELILGDAEFIYSGVSQTQSATIIPAAIAINYSYIGTDGTSYNSTTAPVDAGTYKVTGTSVANTEYASTTSTATLTIKKANVTIQVTLKSEAYTGNPIQLDYTVLETTAIRDLTFTTQYIGIDGTNYNSNSAPSKVGKYQVTISTPGDNNHHETSMEGILNITEGSVNSFTMTSDAFVYDGTAKVLRATIVPNHLTVTYSYQGTLKDGTIYAETATTPILAGDYTVTATFAGDGTHLPASIFAQMEIEKKASKIILKNTVVAYTGNPIYITVKETDPVGAALTIDYVRNTRSFIKNRATAPTDVGLYTATATFAGNNNYEPSSATANLSITVAGVPTLTMDNKTVVYDGNPHSITPAAITGPSTAPQELNIVKYIYQNADYPPSEEAPTNAGVYTVTAETTTSNNFPTAGTVSAMLTIEKAEQSITFDASQLQGKTYGDAPITLTAGTTSELPITFESGNPLIAEINGDELTIKMAGTVSITARQAGNNNCNAAPLVTNSMTIAPTNLVINIDDPQETTYTGGDLNVKPATVTGIIGGASLPIIYEYTKDGQTTSSAGDAGDYKVLVKIAGDDNHVAANREIDLKVKKADVTISLNSKSVLYTSSPISIDAPVLGGSGTVGNLPITISYKGISGTSYPESNQAPINGGEYEVKVSTVGDKNHNAQSGIATLTITQSSAVVTLTDKQFGYDGMEKTLVATTQPAGLPLTYDYSGMLADGTNYPSTNEAPTEAGVYTVVAHFAGNENYEPTSVTATLTINKKGSSITLKNKSETYTGNPIYITVKETDPVGAIVTITYQRVARARSIRNAATPTDVGVYIATATFAGNNNYEPSSATANLSITVAGVPTLMMDNKTVVYDGNIQSIAPAVITGPSTAPSELSIVKYIYQNADYPPSEEAPTNAGVYTVTAETTTSNNFPTAGTVSAMLTIEKAEQNITFDASQLQGKTYGDVSFSLVVGSTSSLPISFVSGNPEIASIVANKVTMHQTGVVTITAMQGGNMNYHAASSVTHTLSISSNNAELLEFKINGEVYEDISKRFVVPQGYTDGTIRLYGEVETNAQLLNLPSTVDVSKPSIQTIEFSVRSQDGTLTKNYTLEVEKRFQFDELVIIRWNNTMTVINRNNSYGYQFKSYQWYKNGNPILATKGGTLQSYSVGKNGESINSNDSYYVEVTDLATGHVLRCWESDVKLRSMRITAYPVPVERGSIMTLDADIDEEYLEGAMLYIHNTIGVYVKSQKVTGRLTSIPMDLAVGTYILTVTGTKGFNTNIKVVVK